MMIKVLYKQGWLFWVLLLTQLSIMIPQHVYIKDVFCLLVIITSFKYTIWDSSYRLLLVFSFFNAIFMFLFSITPSNFETLSYLLGPIAYYIIGCRLVSRCESNDELTTCILFLFIVSIFHVFYINLTDAMENGIVNVLRRIYLDDGTLTGSATLQGLVVSLGLPGVCYLISNRYELSLKSVLFTSCSLAAIFCVIHLVNRSGLFALFGSILLTFIYTQRTSKTSFIWLGLFAVFLYSVMVRFDILNEDITTAYVAREDDASIYSGSDRFGRWGDAIIFLFTKPMGWYGSNNSLYVHNLWLDIARCTGIVPFILFFVSSIKMYRKTYELFKIKDNPTIGFMIGIVLCLTLSDFVEPVLEGVSTCVYFLCMFWGIQTAYLQRNDLIDVK